MSTKTPPRHGERACYVRGCRRPECCDANYRYMSRIRLDYEHGQRRRRDATQTRVHLERLIAAGWTRAQIARAAGLAHRTVGSVHAGYPTVANTTARAILSVRIAPPPADTRDVDATGTVRRVRALVAIGWPIAQLAPRVGLYTTALALIARGERTHVRATTAARIAREYRRLSRTPGASVRARNDARRHGWHGPLAWDIEAIDDPDVQPETGEDIEPGFRERAALRREEIIHLAWCGHEPEHIHTRLDGEVSISTIRQTVHEWRTGQKRERTKAANAGLERAA